MSINNLNYQICSRCVMDTSDPLITFDKNNYCNLCTDFLENRKQAIHSSDFNNKALEDLFNMVKRKILLTQMIF